jgi:hypothetical protein
MAIGAAYQGERWDPNEAVDKLKSGVMSRFREQQQKRSPARERPRKPAFLEPEGGTTTSSETHGGPSNPTTTTPQVQADEGTTP